MTVCATTISVPLPVCAPCYHDTTERAMEICHKTRIWYRSWVKLIWCAPNWYRWSDDKRRGKCHWSLDLKCPGVVRMQPSAQKDRCQ